MILTRSMLAVLLVTAVGLSACAGGGEFGLSNSGLASELYPTPRHDDLPVGIDEGLITRDWDGGHPLRFLAFIMNPLGVAADLGLNQLAYLVTAQNPELTGYTNQDELYRRRFQQQRYSWDTFYYQYQQYKKEGESR